MSGLGDIEDWDYRPPDPLSTSAARTSTVRAGRFSDIVNAFIPVNDDIALVGGDHSIFRFTGDPRDGGQFDKLPVQIGMTFGRPWCLAPDGSVWFFGIPPGLYRMAPGGLPERVSVRSLDDTDFANDIDLATHYVRLYYDDVQKGIAIFQFPYATSTTVVNHWFVELKTHSAASRTPIWRDTFTGSMRQVSAAMVVDGDEADDRMLILGCEDAMLRNFSPTAKNDNGTAIDSSVTVGPLSVDGETDVALYELTAEFSTSLEGMRVEYFASQEAEKTGDILDAAPLSGGRNSTVRKRVGGKYVFLRFRNAFVDESWALEKIVVNMEKNGRTRANR
jgi:hypothetical protein